MAQIVGQATILAGLVPNGLFVSIAIAYALAAVRIARMGALVQQSNAVESLSHVDTLCLDKTGTLTTTNFKVDQWHPMQSATRDSCGASSGRSCASAAHAKPDGRGDRGGVPRRCRSDDGRHAVLVGSPLQRRGAGAARRRNDGRREERGRRENGADERRGPTSRRTRSRRASMPSVPRSRCCPSSGDRRAMRPTTVR